MFQIFNKKKDLNFLSHRGISMIRSDARALIQIANAAESKLRRICSSDTDSADGSHDARALMRAEEKLAASIYAVVLTNIAKDIIERDVIIPTLAQAVLVGGMARDSINRALSTAGRS